MELKDSFIKLENNPFPYEVFWKSPVQPTASPAVLVMHELNGMTIPILEFANRLVENGFTVYLPLMFGNIGEPSSGPKYILNTINFTGYMCISKEFNAFKTSEASPITNVIREICKYIYKLNQHSQFPGIGAVGMCLTGGFVLSLLLEKEVVAPVMGHPSLPFGLTTSQRQSLGLSPQDLEQAKPRVKETDLLFVRFAEDRISPPERQQVLEDAFGCSLKKVIITAEQRKQDGIASPLHSALAGNYADKNNQPYPSTKAAFEQVAQFLKHRLNS